MWTFDPSEIAEQTLIRDFNRNNMMLLKKYILFSRLTSITVIFRAASAGKADRLVHRGPLGRQPTAWATAARKPAKCPETWTAVISIGTEADGSQPPAGTGRPVRGA